METRYSAIVQIKCMLDLKCFDPSNRDEVMLNSMKLAKGNI